MSTFNLAAAVKAGLASGVKCDRCHEPHANSVSLDDWRKEWRAQVWPKPAAVLAPPVVKDEDE